MTKKKSPKYSIENCPECIRILNDLFKVFMDLYAHAQVLQHDDERMSQHKEIKITEKKKDQTAENSE